MSLTPKQQRFVEEYLVDLNAAAAARRAGYSAKSSDHIGYQLLQIPTVQDAVSAGRQALMRRTEITQEYVIGRLHENVERAMQAVPVFDSEGKPTGDYTYKGAVANRALELLGKHLGMFTDRLEHTGKGGGPIQVEELDRAIERELAYLDAARKEPVADEPAGAPKANGFVRPGEVPH